MQALVKANKMLHMFWKKPNITNKKYKTHFESCITVLDSYGGCVYIHLDLLTAKLKTMKMADVENKGDRE